MNLKDIEYIPISRVCTVERAVSGKIYREGTCFVKLSAVDEEVGQLKEAGKIESRYAALEPKEGVDPDYLLVTVENAFPEFLRKYRTTLNLQADTLEHFVIPWHKEQEARKYVVDCMRFINGNIDRANTMIEQEKQLKDWYLSKMMV